MFKKRSKASVAAPDAPDQGPPSAPAPMTKLIIADLALRAGQALLKRGVEKGIVGGFPGAKKAGRVIKGRTVMQTVVGTAIARIATRSVPGAIIVGGGMLAKTLYDRKHGSKTGTKTKLAGEPQATPADKK